MTADTRTGAALVVLAAALAALPGAAQAQSERVIPYRFEQVWPTAIRFLRIEEGVAISEKDAEGGYILFVLGEERRQFRGALEVVRIRDLEGRAAVRLLLRIQERPAYMEEAMLVRLVDKVRRELGPPTQREKT